MANARAKIIVALHKAGYSLDEAGEMMADAERYSVRDRFAMAALTGILTNPKCDTMEKDEVVKVAWATADRMLEARENK